jgi:hypothetical protein
METSDFSKPLIIYINDINDRHSEFLNNDEIWRYWFEEEGTIIFSYFLFAQFWNVGDIINVSFAFDLYDNGVLKRNFIQDFGSPTIKIINKFFEYHYSDEGDERKLDQFRKPNVTFDFEIYFQNS